MVGSRCHLSDFFQMEGEAKTPKVGERGKEVGCGCGPDRRVMKGFRSSSKLIFEHVLSSAKYPEKNTCVHSGSRNDMKPKAYGNRRTRKIHE